VVIGVETSSERGQPRDAGVDRTDPGRSRRDDGAIRQEILSGIRTAEQSRKLRDRLRAFEDVTLHEVDYEEAATCFNRCRAKGLQGSNTDFLMCAVSLRHDLAILTTDQDFEGFANVLGFELHEPR
jgi:predicted nucleic acid-binding protein